MKKLTVAAAIAVATLLFGGFALTNTASGEPTGPAPTPAASTPAATTPAPAAVVVTNVQIADCAQKTLEATKMTEQRARQIAVDAKMPVMGIDRIFKKGDTVWGFCKVTLADPVLADLASQVAKNEAIAKSVESMLTEFRALDAQFAKLPASIRGVYKTSAKASFDNMKALQASIVTSNQAIAAATNVRLAALAAPKQAAAAPTPAAPATGAQTPVAAKAKT